MSFTAPMKFTQLVNLSLILVAGCAATPPQVAAPTDPHVLATPEYAAMAYILNYESSADSNEQNFYAAYVVPKSPVGDALAATLSHLIPPVTNSITVDTNSGPALDAKTRKNVKVWSVGAATTISGEVTVSVHCHGRYMATEWYEIMLQCSSGGIWHVTKKILVWIL